MHYMCDLIKKELAGCTLKQKDNIWKDWSMGGNFKAPNFKKYM